MKKNLFAALLCVIMVLTLLPATAFAANATSVFIAGQELTSTKPYYHNGPSGGQGTVNNIETGYNAYFNESAGTLTLNGLDVRASTVQQKIGEGASAVGFTYAIFANGDLTIKMTADSAVSTGAAAAGSANVALGVNGNLTFTGSDSSKKLTATAGAGESTTGVYILGDLEVSSGTLEGATGTAGSAATSEAECFGVGAMGTLKVSGGSLIGQSGTATATSNSISTGIGAGVVTVSGGKITATGDTATVAHSLSYGLYVTSLNIQAGETYAKGGEAKGGATGGFSDGVNVFDVTVSGGSLTAQGGNTTATGYAYSQSCGIYAEADSVSFSGGTVEATGGKAGNSSFGIRNAGVFDSPTPSGKYKSGGAITVSGTADVTANGGTAQDSFGLWCRGTGLKVSGGKLSATGGNGSEYSTGVCTSGDGTCKIEVTSGELTAKSESATNTFALNRVLTLGPGVEAKGSTSSSGSNPGDYLNDDVATYKWVLATSSPTLLVTASPSGSVAAGTGVTLTATPVNMESPTYQWYSNTTNSATGGSKNEGATAETYTPPTDKAGTVYYYCVANKGAVSNVTSNIVGVAVSQPSGGGDYTPSPVTVYNDSSVPNATVWLSGSGLDSSDLLVTKRDPKGSAYEALMKLADSDDVFATYNIYLLSGKKSTGSTMSLTFDLDSQYAGQDFTLVHQKADSTYEYFYDTADANGDLSFGPIYELSPFMLVKGTLAQTLTSAVKIPATGDRSHALLWGGIALISLFGAAAYIVRRNRA